MAQDKDATLDAEVRRRLLMLSLGIKPRELARAAGISPAQASHVLTAHARMCKGPLAGAMRLITERARALLGAESE